MYVVPGPKPFNQLQWDNPGLIKYRELVRDEPNILCTTLTSPAPIPVPFFKLDTHDPGIVKKKKRFHDQYAGIRTELEKQFSELEPKKISVEVRKALAEGIDYGTKYVPDLNEIEWKEIQARAKRFDPDDDDEEILLLLVI